MKSNQIAQILSQLDSEVYIQVGDDAYPAKVRVFMENGKPVPYITVDNVKEHRNFPDKYGSKEIKI